MVFGSILTPRFNEESDVDLLVDFEDSKIELLDYADNFFGFLHALENVMQRKIDITVNSSIRNRFFRKEVDETRQLNMECKINKILEDIYLAICEIDGFFDTRDR